MDITDVGKLKLLIRRAQFLTERIEELEHFLMRLEDPYGGLIDRGPVTLEAWRFSQSMRSLPSPRRPSQT